MAKLNLSPPWAIFYQELKALFGADDEITIVYNEEGDSIKLYVDNPDKAEALTELLPTKKEWGVRFLDIQVIPSNTVRKIYATEPNRTDTAYLFERAFRYNPAFDYAKTISGVFTNNLTYVVFRNKVVQYYNDSLSDIHGLCSTLYESIARNIFEEKEGVFFCTNTPEQSAVVDYNKACANNTIDF